jgi:hypothetical protein
MAGFYSIRNGLNDIIITRNNTTHKIGFLNPTLARKVLYNIDPFKEITYLNGFPKIKNNVLMDVDACIIIPKIERNTFDPLLDSNLHLVRYTENEFLSTLSEDETLVMPNALILEDERDFVFKVFTVSIIE